MACLAAAANGAATAASRRSRRCSESPPSARPFVRHASLHQPGTSPPAPASTDSNLQAPSRRQEEHAFQKSLKPKAAKKPAESKKEIVINKRPGGEGLVVERSRITFGDDDSEDEAEAPKPEDPKKEGAADSKEGSRPVVAKKRKKKAASATKVEASAEGVAEVGTDGDGGKVVKKKRKKKTVAAEHTAPVEPQEDQTVAVTKKRRKKVKKDEVVTSQSGVTNVIQHKVTGTHDTEFSIDALNSSIGSGAGTSAW